MPAQTRYLLLDGLRGLAAFSVMLLHFFPILPAGLLGHAFLAVDFFFILSGLVIASAYDRQLLTNMSVGHFWLMRSIRFYPLVIAAVLAILALRLVRPIDGVSSLVQLYRSILNLLLLPDSPMLKTDHFSILPPSWSLFFELVVNLAYAAILPRLTNRRLVAIVAASAIGLVVALYFIGTAREFQDTLPLGLLRTIVSFAIGVAIYRALAAGLLPAWRVPAWLICLVLAAILVAPPLGRANALFEGVAILLVLPALVIAAAQVPLGRRGGAMASLSGELSYPIYVLHMPVASYTGLALGWLHPGETVLKLCAVVVMLVGGWLALRLYDMPVRRWLARTLLTRPVPEHPETAP